MTGIPGLRFSDLVKFSQSKRYAVVHILPCQIVRAPLWCWLRRSSGPSRKRLGLAAAWAMAIRCLFHKLHQGWRCMGPVRRHAATGLVDSWPLCCSRSRSALFHWFAAASVPPKPGINNLLALQQLGIANSFDATALVHHDARFRYRTALRRWAMTRTLRPMHMATMLH